MPPIKPPPLFVLLAHRACREVLAVDLRTWPKWDRVKVLVAALDAELQGEVAMENAAVDAAKVILQRRQAEREARKRSRG